MPPVALSAPAEALPRSEVPAAYRDAAARAGLSSLNLRELARLRPARVVFELFMTACSLATVPLLPALVSHPLVLVASALLSIRTFNCLAQLVHASDHGTLFARPRLNHVVGNLCAHCLGYTRAGHRAAHLNHHLYLNTENDPDRIWGAPDETTGQLARRWLRDLLLVSALARLAQYSQFERQSFSVTPWKGLSAGFVLRALAALGPVALTQLVILGFYTVVVGPVYYLALYVLPILTCYPAQIRLRSTVEHGFDVGYRPRSPEDAWVSRTTVGSGLERVVLAPLGIGYHFEHHLFPGIPHYHLGRLHRLLRAGGAPVPIVPSYLAFVLRKRRAEAMAAAGPRP